MIANFAPGATWRVTVNNWCSLITSTVKCQIEKNVHSNYCRAVKMPTVKTSNTKLRPLKSGNVRDKTSIK